MRAVIQRVKAAHVVADGVETGRIGAGLLVFVGVETGDTVDDGNWLADKVVQLRVFEDSEGKMNRNLTAIGGEVLVISQFTLLGHLKKGTRPSFNRAAAPAEAVPLYEAFCGRLETLMGKPVATGVFGADMAIPADNDGPVTLILDSRRRDW